MNKAVILGTLTLVAVISLVSFFSIQQPINIFPQHDTMQSSVTQRNTSEYSGILQNGNSLLGYGKAIVELTFQDGRYFTASEQMAAEANMHINGIYLITFNAEAPEVAIGILEKQP